MDIIVKISVFYGNIHVPLILSAFHGNINIPCILSAFRGYICTPWILSAFCGYCPHFVDTIVIGHIKTYLARNICHFLHSFVLVMDIIFGHITSYLARNVNPISNLLLIYWNWLVKFGFIVFDSSPFTQGTIPQYITQ